MMNYCIFTITKMCVILYFWFSSLLIEQQKTDPQHFPQRQFIQRRPGPPTMVPSKNPVSNQIPTQLSNMNALFNTTQSQALLQSHSHASPSTTGSGSNSKNNNSARSSLNDLSRHSGPGNTNYIKVQSLKFEGQNCEFDIRI